MEGAARKLPTLPRTKTADALPVYFMSGREHWAMTAFCAFSLVKSNGSNFLPTVMDDGSLNAGIRGELQRILPDISFYDFEACDERVRAYLDPGAFPALHAMRQELHLMRKLMDLHAGLTGWKLFLDSDMLFFREAEWMKNWIKSPDQPVYMQDFQNSYGYALPALERILGRPMPQMVNTGICGLRSDAIDWDQLEWWAKQLLHVGGTNHFSEQCLTAMLFGEAGGSPIPPDYLIWPSLEESRRPSAVMHHYVAESRTWYHIFGWPGVLSRKD